MSKTAVRGVFDQIDRETRFSVTLAKPATNLSEIPEPLRPLYAISDGVTLPFGDVYPALAFRTERFPSGWFCFGANHSFSFFLCHRSSSPSITTWDLESGTRIEAVFDTAYDWLVDEYREYIESDLRSCRLCVSEIPAGARKTAVLKHLKPLANKTSSEWLGVMRAGSFTIDDANRLDAITAVRALQQIGVACHVDCRAGYAIGFACR
jgi:hypothetical protein